MGRKRRESGRPLEQIRFPCINRVSGFSRTSDRSPDRLGLTASAKATASPSEKADTPTSLCNATLRARRKMEWPASAGPASSPCQPMARDDFVRRVVGSELDNGVVWTWEVVLGL